MNLRRSAAAIGVVVAVGLGLVGCSSSSAVPEARADLSGPVDLGNGRSIHIECRGSGSPTVVLVSGLGDRADTWMATSAAPTSPEGSVLRGVEGVTRVCAYDRPGTATDTEGGLEPSRSTPVERPATVADSAADLDLLLAASGEPGPYVLVGHSLGGPIVRPFAAAHYDQVAGLVFVDALSEDLGDGLTPEQVVSFEALNDPVTQGRPAGSEQALYAAAVVPLMRACSPRPSTSPTRSRPHPHLRATRDGRQLRPPEQHDLRAPLPRLHQPAGRVRELHLLGPDLGLQRRHERLGG